MVVRVVVPALVVEPLVATADVPDAKPTSLVELVARYAAKRHISPPVPPSTMKCEF